MYSILPSNGCARTVVFTYQAASEWQIFNLKYCIISTSRLKSVWRVWYLDNGVEGAILAEIKVPFKFCAS